MENDPEEIVGRHAETSPVYPIQFARVGNLRDVPVPYVHVSLCGMITVEVFKEVIHTDPPLARYEALPLHTLRGRGVVPALTLLKLLLTRPQRFASKDWLAEQLQRDDEATTEVRLDTIASQLRKLLRVVEGKEQETIGLQLVAFLRNGRQSGPGYQLAPYPLLWLDTDALAWHVEQAVRMERFGDDPLPFWERAYTLAARGHCLPDEDYSDWAVDKREQVDGLLRQCVHALAHLYLARHEEAGEQAALLLVRAYWQAHKMDEDALRVLMKLLGQQERYQEALTYVQQAREALAEEGCELDPRTQDIAEYLRTKQISRTPNPKPPNPSVSVQKAPPHADEQFALMPAPMVQLPQTQQSVLIEPLRSAFEAFVPSEHGVLYPQHALLTQTPVLVPSYDVATWFGARVNELKTSGASWYSTTSTCQQQQTLIHAEVEKWNAMTDHISDELRITRRTALATLATLANTLLIKVHTGPLTARLAEEFLAQCTLSITACYHLLSGDGLVTVEYALPIYLPVLLSLAKQPSPYQHRAAYLAAQGCWLMGLVAHHRLHFEERVAYGKQSVEFARLSEDRTLLVMLLASLGNAWYNVGQQAEMRQKQREADTAFAWMLQAYQEAASMLAQAPQDVPKLLYSKVFAGLAHAYAQHAAVQEALRWIAEARSVFSEQPENVPSFLATDYGIYQVILFEGLTFLDLSKHDRTGDYDKQAWEKLEQIEQLPAHIFVPERIHVEIVNQRALAAVRTGDMEAFRTYFMSGVQGAQALGSEKRRQEAIANWKAARDQWPQEKRVMELADLLF